MWKSLIAALLIAMPFAAQAKEKSCNNGLKKKDIQGTYVAYGFSNSLPIVGEPTNFQSIGVIFQSVFNRDGTGTIVALDEAAVIGGQAVDVIPGNPVNLPFTYKLNYLGVSGYALITVPNFPAPNVTTQFVQHFKVQNGEVVGFVLLAPTNLAPATPPSAGLWLVAEGFKVN